MSKHEELELAIAKAERALFFNALHEAVYCQRKRRGKKTARAVLHKDRNAVELVGTDKKTLASMYSILTGKGTVETTTLSPISEDDLMKAMGPGERTVAGKMLKE